MLAEGLALCFRDSVRRLLLGSILTRFHSADLLELEQDATEDEATGHKFSPLLELMPVVTLRIVVGSMSL